MIEFEDVRIAYKDKPVLDGVSLTIHDREFFVLIGSSGCGKTTITRLVNGLIPQFYAGELTGSVLVDGQEISNKLLPLRGGSLSIDGIPVEQIKVQDLPKKVGYVVQSGGLFPHLTVEENIALTMQIARFSKEAIRDRVDKMLKMVNLDPEIYRGQYPSQLSGGQQQRVGIARAFAANPPIVLMDEPFSALDPMTRAELQNEIHDLQTKAQKTVVFVTHDMDEAIKLADRICIIQDGKVAQCDTPENILKHPANQYVTEIIGANRLWANPEYIRAADIMRRRPFTISKGRTVIQALQIMRHNSVESLLVLDKGQTLLGVVWLEELIGKREADPIEYYISDDYIAVEGETSLKEIIATIDYDVSGIIPVIQHDRKLLGYLTKSIILATMSKQFVPEHTAGERSGVICPATL